MRLLIRMRRNYVTRELVELVTDEYQRAGLNFVEASGLYWFWEYHPYLRWSDGHETWIGGSSNRWDIAVQYGLQALRNPDRYARIGFATKRRPLG